MGKKGHPRSLNKLNDHERAESSNARVQRELDAQANNERWAGPRSEQTARDLAGMQQQQPPTQDSHQPETSQHIGGSPQAISPASPGGQGAPPSHNLTRKDQQDAIERQKANKRWVDVLHEVTHNMKTISDKLSGLFRVRDTYQQDKRRACSETRGCTTGGHREE